MSAASPDAGLPDIAPKLADDIIALPSSSSAPADAWRRQATSLTVGVETLAADVMTPADRSSPVHTLFLHGAGQSTRQRQWPLREKLASLGHASAAIDFSGHGESTALAPNSLQKRLREAQAALDALLDVSAGPRTVVGVSMSGEIAMRLACCPENQISHVVTVVGAIYDSAAFEIPFGPDFTAALRRPDSWRDAESLKLIGSYAGRITIVRALEDRVIPHHVAELIKSRAAGTCRIVDLPGVDHRVSERSANDPALLTLLAQLIAN